MATLKRLEREVRQAGIILVFPVNNQKEPPSLWHRVHPRSPMRWEWDEGGDDRVARLWHLREELSRKGTVVYTKWFRNRATFFAPWAFRSMAAALGAPWQGEGGLSKEAGEILHCLRESSPRATKELRRETGLRGRLLESTYQKALRELWERLLVVGYGEVEEGGFPSLALGATELLFESLWKEAAALSADEGRKGLEPVLEACPLFQRHFEKILRKLPTKYEAPPGWRIA